METAERQLEKGEASFNPLNNHLLAVQKGIEQNKIKKVCLGEGVDG